ncbi:hypothetical protein [Mannheimia massilioguelmaensis]|uniref:hypothetical protein n=1 Tax=Mannheimia massilioguelmaensis TaxID=1604354 RepID=UPI0005C882A9|nr:hypothetical protein [Mannheimia massilioguelmaensis]
MKYRLTENTVEYCGKTLYQIEALKDFEIKREWALQVKKGDLGGYIEKESNLSQKGNCWITKAVYVLDNARVENDAVIECCCVVRENSRVFGRAWLSDERFKKYKSDISGQAKIYGDAFIYKVGLTMADNAKIYGNAEASHTQFDISDNAIFSAGRVTGNDKGHITVRDNAEIRGGCLDDNCCVSGNAKIYGGCVSDNAQIYGNAQIYDSDICGEAIVEGNTEVKFDTNISGNAYLCGNAIVERDEDIMTFSNIGTLALLLNEEIEGMQHLTFFRAGDKMQMTIGGDFYDDTDKFLQHMKLFCQNLQATLEMAEKRFG